MSFELDQSIKSFDANIKFSVSTVCFP